MNIKLLKKVRDTILVRYKQLDMDQWFERMPSDVGGEPPINCGTTACIAGWAITLSDQPRSRKPEPRLSASKLVKSFATRGWSCGANNRAIKLGRTALELTPGQAERLFFRSDWPTALSDSAADARPGTKKYAQIVARRIDLFIETNGET